MYVCAFVFVCLCNDERRNLSVREKERENHSFSFI